MSLFDHIARAFAVRQTVAPTPPPTPKPMAFSHSVGSGYVDTAGKWYATKAEADWASGRIYLQINTPDWDEYLRNPDTIRAMAILGMGEP